MHERRRAVVVSRWGGLVIIAAAVAACEGIIEPSSEAVRLEGTTPNSLAGTVGAELPTAPTVRAMDAEGRGVAGVAVTFHVGSGSVAPAQVTTDANGSAAVSSWTLGPTAGPQRITASAAGLASVVLTATAEAGPVERITPVSGNPQLAGIGKQLAQPLVARVTDAFGNPVPGSQVTFTVISGGGSIETGPVPTDANGIATSAPWTLGPVEGVQQVSAASNPTKVTFSAFAVAPPGELQGELAFVRWADGDLDIYRIGVDGGGLRRLTTVPGADYQPAWSPDGSQIAFISERENEHDYLPRLTVMTADGAEVWRRTDGPPVCPGCGWDQRPSWSPGGIAFSVQLEAGPQIATIGSAGGAITVLTTGPIPSSEPSWSPDGGRLVFVSSSTTNTAYHDGIYALNADGRGRVLRGPQSLPQAMGFQHPAWSPDGSMIAFLYIAPASGGVRFRVAIMTEDGLFLKDLARAGDIALPEGDEVAGPESLTWSPDGRGVAYSYLDCDLEQGLPCSYERSVRYVSLDGSVEGTLIANAESPSWRP